MEKKFTRDPKNYHGTKQGFPTGLPFQRGTLGKFSLGGPTKQDGGGWTASVSKAPKGGK